MENWRSLIIPEGSQVQQTPAELYERFYPSYNPKTALFCSVPPDDKLRKSRFLGDQGWGADEQLMWCGAILLGLPPDALYEFTNITTSRNFYRPEVMNDRTQSRSIRQKEYHRFTNLFLQVAQDYLQNPIGNHLLYTGHEQSLGSLEERYISRISGIPVYHVLHDASHIFFPQKSTLNQSSLIAITPDAEPIADWYNLEGLEVV